MSDFNFRIETKMGVLSENAKSGWTKEINRVSWNGGVPKFDIRDWSPDHQHMGKGITLTEEEARKVLAALSQYFSGGDRW